jgi:hypothetical protein
LLSFRVIDGTELICLNLLAIPGLRLLLCLPIGATKQTRSSESLCPDW